MAAKSGDENWGKLAASKAPSMIRELCDDPRSRGRPVIHDPSQYQAEIVTRLMTGESLPMICTGPAMPSLRTVNRWMADDDEFTEAVNRARQLGVNALMDAAVSIASGGAHSTGSVERDKLLCGVIRWIVAKRDPDKAPYLCDRSITISIDPSDADW